MTTEDKPRNEVADIGPQRGPASIGQINAQVKQAKQQLADGEKDDHYYESLLESARDEINRLQAERDRLADDAEVGRLVREVIEPWIKKPGHLVKLYHGVEMKWPYWIEFHATPGRGFARTRSGATLQSALERSQEDD